MTSNVLAYIKHLMKDELYFLKLRFVKKLIVKKHKKETREWIEACPGEEVFTDMLMYTQDKIIREWIDWYYTHDIMWQKVLDKLPHSHELRKTKTKPLKGLRYLINYLS